MRVLAVLAAIALSGCAAQGLSSEPSPVPRGVVVERIFVIDGCVGYRFFDYGARYFVRCGQEAVPVEAPE